jgi:hypothetical protein
MDKIVKLFGLLLFCRKGLEAKLGWPMSLSMEISPGEGDGTGETLSLLVSKNVLEKLGNPQLQQCQETELSTMPINTGLGISKHF